MSWGLRATLSVSCMCLVSCTWCGFHMLSYIQKCLIFWGYSCSPHGKNRCVLLLHLNLSWRLSRWPFQWCWDVSTSICHWMIIEQPIEQRIEQRWSQRWWKSVTRPALFATMSTSDDPSVGVLLTCLSDVVMVHFLHKALAKAHWSTGEYGRIWEIWRFRRPWNSRQVSRVCLSICWVVWCLCFR